MIKSNRMKKEFNIVGMILCVVVILTYMYPTVVEYINDNYSDFINIFSYGFIDNCILILSALITYLLPILFFAPLLFVNVFHTKDGGNTKLVNVFGFIVVGIGIYLVGNALNSGIIFMFNSQDMYNIPVNESLLSNFFEVKFTYFVYMYLLYPVLQELLFRSVILKTLNRYGNYFSIIISSIMFAVIVGRLQTFIPMFMMGCFLAVISLYNKNISTVLCVRIGIELFIFSEMFFPSSSFVFGLITLLIYALSGLFIYKNRSRQIVMRDDENQSYVIKTFFKSFMVIISIILFFVLFKFPFVIDKFINFISQYI